MSSLKFITFIQTLCFPRSKYSESYSKKRPRVIHQCLNDLTQGLSTGRVRDIGRFITLHEGARLCQPLVGKIDSQKSEWGPALYFATRHLQETIGVNLISIYVRGSVASGHALTDGRSDLDLVTLVRGPVPTRAISDELSHSLRLKWPFIHSADVAFHSLDVNDEQSLPESTRFLLLAYCAHLHGQDVRPTLGCASPSPDALIDLRSAERRVLQGQFRNPETRVFAFQWFLKRCLRGLVDIASYRVGTHSRDIVPCARILQQTYPELEDLICTAAVLACEPVTLGVADIGSHQDWLSRAEPVVCDMADWAEREFLKFRFGGDTRPQLQLAKGIVTQQQTAISLLRKLGSDSIAMLARLREPSIRKHPKSQFVRDELQPLAIFSTKPIQVMEIRENYNRSAILSSFTAPVVFRGVLESSTRFLNDCNALIAYLESSSSIEDVRLSGSPEFIFCLERHEWVRKDQFTPPSVLVRMQASEFFARALGSLPPLRYINERVYLQSEVNVRERVFDKLRHNSSILLAQPERRWVSTHGAVSTTHYDSAHSALAQIVGEKRMFFFPPSALPIMGSYPTGHPLQRRCSINLKRPESRMFRDFWDKCIAIEVLIQPGDVVVFPPFWSHYTESLADNYGLCASHTVRFLRSEELLT